MARATRAGGPSYTPEELADPSPPIRPRRAEIGFIDRPEEESKSATPDGGDSTQSLQSDNPSSDKLKPAPRKRARTTGSHSKATDKTATGSDADSTDTDGQRTETQSPDDDGSAEELEFDEFA